jgi:hypothetical protein
LNKTKSASSPALGYLAWFSDYQSLIGLLLYQIQATQCLLVDFLVELNSRKATRAMGWGRLTLSMEHTTSG